LATPTYSVKIHLVAVMTLITLKCHDLLLCIDPETICLIAGIVWGLRCCYLCKYFWWQVKY